jgi:hypothetical protein
MSMLFGSPKTPAVPAPIPPPTIDQATTNADAADRLRQRQGRASTILTPNLPDLAAPVRKSTLGS